MLCDDICDARRSACKPFRFWWFWLSILHALRSAKTRYDAAALLGYKPSALSFIVHRIPKEAKYKIFTIKKKGGGERRIDAPIPKLKGLQKRLASVLYECLRE